jgi:hypothetical protein
VNKEIYYWKEAINKWDAQYTIKKIVFENNKNQLANESLKIEMKSLEEANNVRQTELDKSQRRHNEIESLLNR